MATSTSGAAAAADPVELAAEGASAAALASVAAEAVAAEELELPSFMASRKIGSGSPDLLLLLADRLAGAVHGLKITSVLDLLNGKVKVDSFGLEEQAFIDFKDRLSVGNSTAVQREVEGPSGAKLLMRLSTRDQRAAQSLTVVARLLNDPSIAEYIGHQLALQAAQAAGLDGSAAGGGSVATAAGGTTSIESKRRGMTQAIMAVLKRQQPDLEELLTVRQLRTVRADVERLSTDFYAKALGTITSTRSRSRRRR